MKELACEVALRMGVMNGMSLTPDSFTRPPRPEADSRHKAQVPELCNSNLKLCRKEQWKLPGRFSGSGGSINTAPVFYSPGKFT